MPVTKKGAIRVQMEKELEAYSQRGGRVLIVRAGIFGPRAGNNWFSQGLIKPGKLHGVITNLVRLQPVTSGLIYLMSRKR